MPRDEHHRLGAEAGRALHHVRRRPRRVAGELDQARPVAQVDEDQAAEVAAPVDPAAQAHLAADLGTGESTGRR